MSPRVVGFEFLITLLVQNTLSFLRLISKLMGKDEGGSKRQTGAQKELNPELYQ